MNVSGRMDCGPSVAGKNIKMYFSNVANDLDNQILMRKIVSLIACSGCKGFAPNILPPSYTPRLKGQILKTNFGLWGWIDRTIILRRLDIRILLVTWRCAQQITSLVTSEITYSTVNKTARWMSCGSFVIVSVALMGL